MQRFCYHHIAKKKKKRKTAIDFKNILLQNGETPNALTELELMVCDS